MSANSPFEIFVDTHIKFETICPVVSVEFFPEFAHSMRVKLSGLGRKCYLGIISQLTIFFLNFGRHFHLH